MSSIETLDKQLRQLRGAEFEVVNRIAKNRGYGDGRAMCVAMNYWTLTLRELLNAYPDPGPGGCRGEQEAL